MRPIDAAIVNTLKRTGRPCGIDDVVTSLPRYRWAEVFSAVGRMARGGRVLLSPVGNLTYTLSLVLHAK